MPNDSQFMFRVGDDLREEFVEACQEYDRPAGQVLREYMRSFVRERAQRELPFGNWSKPTESSQARRSSACHLRDAFRGLTFHTVLADPPWQFQNRTGKMAPEHRRLTRYETMRLPDIAALPVRELVGEPAHLYLWVPNALLPDGLAVMAAWGFSYKSNIVWHKVRKDGQPDGRGVGFYFRNTTELLLFGVRGRSARTLPPGRRQVNVIRTLKREHSRKPDEQYDIIESCSPGPYLELFARGSRPGWHTWGDQADEYDITWPTYANHSRGGAMAAE